ncbi:uncharacterized protein LOC123715269 [Pieris brassicae]|uniref:uncharacterized protein LOC123715269 n=1 Tax=Pieris brassicae TaxID=7116 RepID=UPI001E660303|nr:uncharacterized protein LOC123715269 [Pieris brassicae]
MARTKASVGAKVSMGKSSKARCSAAPPPSNSSSSGERSSRSYSGGNPVCPREIPKWQKPITTFIFTKQKKIEDSDAGSSKSKLKRQIIYSDDESDSEIKNNSGDMNNKVDKSDNTNEIENVESQVHAVSQVLESEVKESVGKENVDSKSEVVESQDYDLMESPPKNRELDESIILEPLTGESSHKLEEYYPKTAKKPKGVSKIIDKENFNNKVKRNLDDVYEESPNKKMRME